MNHHPNKLPFEEGGTGFQGFPIPEDVDAAPVSGYVSPFASGEMNAVLRGEISAMEAYFQVLEKIAHDRDAQVLNIIHNDHMQAVAYWKSQIRGEGDTAARDSGIWGSAVEAFVGTAKLLGNTAALSALLEGEEHGLRQYEDILNENVLTPAQDDHVRLVCMPRQQEHIQMLRNLKV